MGRGPPNAFGLCDLHGHLGELCLDRYDAEAYSRLPLVDPVELSPGNTVVVRGGAVGSPAMALRSAFRSGMDRSTCGVSVGFRVAIVGDLSGLKSK